MVIRKRRTRVVVDTNVLVAFYLHRNPRSANAAVVKLWRDQRLLELVVSAEIVSEYLEVLSRFGVGDPLLRRFSQRLQARATVTFVNLGPRVVASRDPDDNVFLSTARAGHASFLVTNDLDLLELPDNERRMLRFEIVSPATLLSRLAVR